jgi:sodium/bile acid cotransporter 7
MRGFLAKRWFLLLLSGGLGLAWWMPRAVSACTSRLETRAVVALALCLMALSLESRRLVEALVRPLPALWAAAISYGAMPVLGWLAGWLLPNPDLRIGLMLIVSVPCTLASAVLWTRMAGGDEATALLVILLTTSTSWLATTAWLVVATDTVIALDTAALMRGLILVLIVPVGLGQLLRSIAPLARLAGRHRGVLGVVAQLLVYTVILQAAVEVSLKLEETAGALTPGVLVATAAVCVGTHLTGLAGGLWSSRGLGFARPSRIAVAFAGSQKTLPVALFLYHDYFKNTYPLAVVSLAFYHVGQLVVDTFIADRLAGGGLAAAKVATPS